PAPSPPLAAGHRPPASAPRQRRRPHPDHPTGPDPGPRHLHAYRPHRPPRHSDAPHPRGPPTAPAHPLPHPRLPRPRRTPARHPATRRLSWLAHHTGPNRDLRWWDTPPWTPRWHNRLVLVLALALASGLGLVAGLVIGLASGLVLVCRAGLAAGRHLEDPHALV